MRISFFAVLAAFVLAACSPKPMNPEEIGSVEPFDIGGQTAYSVARDITVDTNHPEGGTIQPKLRHVVLASASGRRKAPFAIMPFSDFAYHEERDGLGPYRGADAAELLVFMNTYGGNARVFGRKNLCAPTSFVLDAASWMIVVSDRNNYGLRQTPGKGCKWALVVKDRAL